MEHSKLSIIYNVMNVNRPLR